MVFRKMAAAYKALSSLWDDSPLFLDLDLTPVVEAAAHEAAHAAVLEALGGAWAWVEAWAEPDGHRRGRVQPTAPAATAQAQAAVLLAGPLAEHEVEFRVLDDDPLGDLDLDDWVDDQIAMAPEDGDVERAEALVGRDSLVEAAEVAVRVLRETRSRRVELYRQLVTSAAANGGRGIIRAGVTGE